MLLKTRPFLNQTRLGHLNSFGIPIDHRHDQKIRCYDIGGPDIGGPDIGGFLATLEALDIGGPDIGGLATLEVFASK